VRTVGRHSGSEKVLQVLTFAPGTARTRIGENEQIIFSVKRSTEKYRKKTVSGSARKIRFGPKVQKSKKSRKAKESQGNLRKIKDCHLKVVRVVTLLLKGFTFFAVAELTPSDCGDPQVVMKSREGTRM
jgi:hypothetical protein